MRPWYQKITPMQIYHENSAINRCPKDWWKLDYL